MSSEAEDSAVSASHRALVNQCLNASSSEGSASTLPTCSSSSVSNSEPVAFVSMRDLQDRFNQGRWVERALEEGYQCCLRARRLRRFQDEPDLLEMLLIGWIDL